MDSELLQEARKQLIWLQAEMPGFKDIESFNVLAKLVCGGGADLEASWERDVKNIMGSGSSVHAGVGEEKEELWTLSSLGARRDVGQIKRIFKIMESWYLKSITDFSNPPLINV